MVCAALLCVRSLVGVQATRADNRLPSVEERLGSDPLASGITEIVPVKGNLLHLLEQGQVKLVLPGYNGRVAPAAIWRGRRIVPALVVFPPLLMHVMSCLCQELNNLDVTNCLCQALSL